MKFIILSLWAWALAGRISVAAMVEYTIAQRLIAELAPHLSHLDLISEIAPPRWSSFDAPNPGAVVNVKTESDVAITVKYCTENNIAFLAQNGGVGWATFHLGTDGVLINLASLNQVSISADRSQATIGGGSNISNTIAHAYAARALVETGNCNCVGTLGAALGGGYGNLMGLYGFAVDNVVSLRVVTADGQVRDVTATSDPDLFWGLRGAGPNLGIVTSAVVKAYPASEDDLHAWTGSLVFSPDKLEQVVQAIQNLELHPNMTIFMYFISDSPNEPTIVAAPFLHKGDTASGRSAYASLYAIGPVADTTTVLPYDQWNAASDPQCVFGARKPAWSAGFQEMVPTTWRQIWDKFVEFQQKPGAQSSGVLLEAYSLTKARSEGSPAAFPHRNINFNAFAIPWYDDPSLDHEAEIFGTAVRDLLRSTSGLNYNATYINFAHGDEPLEVVYGNSLSRLRSIKRRFDPKNQFNQWFDIA